MSKCLDHTEVKVGGYEASYGVLLGSDIFVNDSFLKALPMRDAKLPILSIIGLAKASGLPVSKLAVTLLRRFTFSDRVQDYPKDRADSLLNEIFVSDESLIKSLMPTAEFVKETNLLDGVRAIFSTGDKVHIRLSGNAPELLCYIDSDSPIKAADICSYVITRLEQFRI